MLLTAPRLSGTQMHSRIGRYALAFAFARIVVVVVVAVAVARPEQVRPQEKERMLVVQK